MGDLSLVSLMKMVNQLGTGTVGQAATGKELLSTSLGAPFTPPPLPGVAISAQASASVSLCAYGEQGEADPEGVVGPPLPPGGALEALRLSPPLAADGRAYLVYRLEASASAGGSGGAGYFGASAEASHQMLLSDYRAHGLTELLHTAVMADCAGPRTALRTENIAAMRPGDALAIRDAGRVSASVSASWGDMMPSLLGRLGALLPGVDHLVALETRLGASLSAQVSLEDSYVLVFSRPEDGKLRVSLLRAETCDSAVGAGITASVSLDASAPVEALVGALAGRPLAWVDDVVAKAAQAPLTAEIGAALAQVLVRLGLDGAMADPAGLPARWGELKDSLRARLKDLVTARLEASLRYDYQRTEQKQALFQAVFADAEVLPKHGTILSGNLAPLLAALRAGGREPEVYLRQKSVERRRAWGFSMALPFGVTVASSTDEDKLRFVTTTRADGQVRLAALGARRYQGELFGSAAEWGAELHAEMEAFSAAPKSNDFRHGIALFLRRQGKANSLEAQARLVDDAVVWGAVHEADRASVQQQLATAAGDGPVDARVELTVSEEGLRKLLPAATAAAQPMLARALARALPWYGWRARQSADVRAATYASLWEGLLRNGGWAPKDAAATAQRLLAHHPMGKEVAMQEGQWPTPGLVTFASVVNAHPSVAATSQRMLAGLATLAGMIGTASPAQSIEPIFQQLRAGWSQAFLLRAFGALLVAMAGQQGSTKLVERTFTATFPDAGTQLAFTTSG